MKDKYTIGETAKLLGVSTQTLRYYDKINLLVPQFVDSQSGYRYYTYNQFHYIDKIKYLQKFGLSLDEIKNILDCKDISLLVKALNKKKQEKLIEIEELRTNIKDLDWYIDYFMYIENNNMEDLIYKKTLPERYVIKIPCRYYEPLSSMEIRLAEHKSKPEYADLRFHRQYGYYLDFPTFMKREFRPKEYFVFLNKRPDIPKDLYSELPAGEYFCMKTQILHENWTTDLLKKRLQPQEESPLTIALEFEDNLDDWHDAWYEVQIFNATTKNNESKF